MFPFVKIHFLDITCNNMRIQKVEKKLKKKNLQSSPEGTHFPKMLF